MNQKIHKTKSLLINEILGVVLCGGESKRMGSDKGLLTLPGTTQTWAQQVAEILFNCNLPLVISINKTQHSSYSPIFPSEHLILDQINVRGPLNGLLSVHQAHPGKDLLLIACDMIQMDQETLNQLIAIYQENPEFDYYVYEQDKFLEPLCAIYTFKALDAIMKRLDTNELTSFALHKVISSSNYKSIPVKDKRAFTNYNTRDLTS
ncbi:molybdenum cofactor biosynthesis protein C [Arcticibacter svalbardensis MN12-7]|uniref:Molybdenum cofactor biosynthesis protein C n=1 Tax=Arcticibacter svalbardensis MN12-7 TaxID=1150600 RepID=R9H449_9SPHI|nr:molybdenum cofactor guanylyltransferase [Arcticibacter svalbardensis]EOR95964.1 molybdenum cofactor biosynthesis protein C [Arcticibacter svalbardensis MN12-7]